MDRLQEIRTEVREREQSIDVDAIRRRANREWSSLDVLYSGDPDFVNLDEIETVVICGDSLPETPRL